MSQTDDGEPVDPASLAAWERLRADLIELADRRPHVLMSYPTPTPGYRQPPVDIRLDASKPAVDAAAELHARYGDFVSLYVGALRYPARPVDDAEPRRLPVEPSRVLVDPHEMIVELDGALSVPSGNTVTHAVLLRNLGTRRVVVDTDGDLTAVVIEPTTGKPVGRYVGAHHQPLIQFSAEPGDAVRIPLLLGTASLIPALGVAVPPGEWQLIVPIDLEDGRRLVSPPMAFSVTD